MKTIIAFAFILISVISCQSRSEWQVVGKYNDFPCKNMYTECITTHQGEHTLNKCKVYKISDTLFIDFLPELPAYWGSVTVKVHDGKFKTEFNGIPFVPDDISFTTEKKQLKLQKTDYAINDTICGYIDLLFKEVNHTRGNHSSFYYKGNIAEIVRNIDFNPFDKENYMSFDLQRAIHELGEPVNQNQFDTTRLREFRIELLNFFPRSADILIKELTWDTSETRDISDEGKERLTIWYKQDEQGKWMPVHFFIWSTDWQF